MNLSLLKGYLLAAVTMLVVVAAAILVLNNLEAEQPWQMQVFFRPVVLSPAAWLLLAGAGGVVVFLTLWKVLPRAVRSLRAGSAKRQAKADRQAAEKPPAQPPEA